MIFFFFFFSLFFSFSFLFIWRPRRARLSSSSQLVTSLLYWWRLHWLWRTFSEDLDDHRDNRAEPKHRHLKNRVVVGYNAFTVNGRFVLKFVWQWNVPFDSAHPWLVIRMNELVAGRSACGVSSLSQVCASQSCRPSVYQQYRNWMEE